MENMFDCFEEEYKPENKYYLVRRIRNKRSKSQKLLYLEGVNIFFGLVWGIDKNLALELDPYTIQYDMIKRRIRDSQISCCILTIEPVRNNMLLSQDGREKKKTIWEWIKSKIRR